MRVTLTCEECGEIGGMEAEDEDVLHYAIEARTEEHWRSSHYYPNMRYDWSEDL